MRSPARWAALESRLGYVFKDKALLERALTHKSAGDGQPGFPHNERLEWLGDRILGLMTAEHLFHLNARANEGELTQKFNAVVSGSNCADAARRLELHAMVTVSKGINPAAIIENDSILGDAFEALMAALWLDGGRPACETLFGMVLQESTSSSAHHRNPKSALQERAQKLGQPAPAVYTVLERDGPDHAPRFVVQVTVGGRTAHAEGSSKQNAERAAAIALLHQDQGGLNG